MENDVGTGIEGQLPRYDFLISENGDPENNVSDQQREVMRYRALITVRNSLAPEIRSSFLNVTSAAEMMDTIETLHGKNILLDAYELCNRWHHLVFKPHYDKQRYICLLYTSPSPRDRTRSRMPSSA